VDAVVTAERAIILLLATDRWKSLHAWRSGGARRIADILPRWAASVGCGAVGRVHRCCPCNEITYWTTRSSARIPHHLALPRRHFV
jgi:hypothetical protein